MMKNLLLAVAAALAFVTAPLVAQDAGTATPTNPAVEIAFWDSIKDSEDPMLYLAYLEQFPDGSFRVIAKKRLEELWQKALDAFARLEELEGGMTDEGDETDVTPPPPQIIVTPPSPPVVVTPAPKQPKKPGPSATATPTLNRNTQNQLRKHGCYYGGIDGVWGPGSIAAMQRFNARAGTSYPTNHATVAARKYMLSLSKSGVRICK
jgi:hypothetical protein